MTQEEKDLLLQDLCARLPYGVKYMKYSWGYGIDQEIPEVEVLECVDENGYISHTKVYRINDIKPYLFPLSSMTEEQKNDCPIDETNLNIIKSNIGYGIIEIPWQLLYLFIDWCNKNHFDYRGLIPMGLANDATGLNIY